MKKLFLLGTAAALLTSFSAQAEIKQYIALKGAFVHPSMDGNVSYGSLDNSYSEKDKYDWSDNIGGVRLAYGLEVPVWGGAFRPEIELGWNADAEKKSSDPDFGDKEKMKVSTYSAFLNAYYDIHTGTFVTPYIGAGIGYAHIKSKYQYSNEIYDDYVGYKASEGNFAWNVGAGVAFALTDYLSVDVGYKFIDYGSAEKTYTYPEWGEKTKFETDVQAHEATIGLRLTF